MSSSITVNSYIYIYKHTLLFLYLSATINWFVHTYLSNACKVSASTCLIELIELHGVSLTCTLILWYPFLQIYCCSWWDRLSAIIRTWVQSKAPMTSGNPETKIYTSEILCLIVVEYNLSQSCGPPVQGLKQKYNFYQNIYM